MQLLCSMQKASGVFLNRHSMAMANDRSKKPRLLFDSRDFFSIHCARNLKRGSEAFGASCDAVQLRWKILCNILIVKRPFYLCVCL